MRLYFTTLEPWVVQSVWVPSCSSWFMCTQMWDCPLLQLLPHPVLQPPSFQESSPPWLPLPVPPTGLNEYFFFNSLVVGLPYSSIFWKFWLFFFLNLLLSFWLCEEAKCIYLHLCLGWKSKIGKFVKNLGPLP